MKYIFIMLLFTGCATTMREKRIKNTKECMKELLEYGSTTQDAYDVCNKMEGQ